MKIFILLSIFATTAYAGQDLAPLIASSLGSSGGGGHPAESYGPPPLPVVTAPAPSLQHHQQPIQVIRVIHEYPAQAQNSGSDLSEKTLEQIALSSGHGNVQPQQPKVLILKVIHEGVSSRQNQHSPQSDQTQLLIKNFGTKGSFRIGRIISREPRKDIKIQGYLRPVQRQQPRNSVSGGGGGGGGGLGGGFGIQSLLLSKLRLKSAILALIGRQLEPTNRQAPSPPGWQSRPVSSGWQSRPVSSSAWHS